MAEFSKLVITNKGKSLIAKALANMATIEFTKISSSGTAYEVDELESLESITDTHQTSLVSSVSVTNDTSVEIQTSFTNTEVTEGYYLRALGLYANDPDDGEILYGVTAETSGNCYIPAYNSVTSSGIYLQFVTTVGNAENVSLAINPAATATIKNIKDLEEKIKIIDFDDSGEVEGIESFTDFMASFVKNTSIYQFLANLKAGLKYVLHAGQLVNNGLCEESGKFPLDAAYGKTLTDQITQLNSDITEKLPRYDNASERVYTEASVGSTNFTSNRGWYSISITGEVSAKSSFFVNGIRLADINGTGNNNVSAHSASYYVPEGQSISVYKSANAINGGYFFTGIDS